MNDPHAGSAGQAVGAFDDFYATEYRGVFGLAYALTGDTGLAEDLAQDAFMAAWRSWTELDNPAGWVRTVVANKAKSWWRRNAVATRAVSRMAQPVASDPPDEVAGFWETVRRLPRRQSQAIALFYLNDLPVAEIAQILGCEESTARKHLSRGRKNLAARLGVEP